MQFLAKKVFQEMASEKGDSTGADSAHLWVTWWEEQSCKAVQEVAANHSRHGEIGITVAEITVTEATPTQGVGTETFFTLSTNSSPKLLR
jgi:hypothetical protein